MPSLGPFFANDGGPLIVLPRNLLPHWLGMDGSERQNPDELIRDPDPMFDRTDYGRACAAGGWVATLPVGHGLGLVIGADDQAYGVRWFRAPGCADLFLLIPEYSEEHTDDLLGAALSVSGDGGWDIVCPAFSVDSDHLVLFHAACTGTEITEPSDREWVGIGEGIPCPIAPGLYSIGERTLVLPTSPDESKFIICRFKSMQP